jgi:hypothetical protein
MGESVRALVEFTMAMERGSRQKWKSEDGESHDDVRYVNDQ